MFLLVYVGEWSLYINKILTEKKRTETYLSLMLYSVWSLLELSDLSDDVWYLQKNVEFHLTVD